MPQWAHFPLSSGRPAVHQAPVSVWSLACEISPIASSPYRSGSVSRPRPPLAKKSPLWSATTNTPALQPLRRAVNDARAVSSALKEIGFKVFYGENLSRREMNRKLADFELAITPGDDVFFFFAGHGISLGAENFLLPSDMLKPRAGRDQLGSRRSPRREPLD